MSYKVPTSIANLTPVPNKTDFFSYDFICSETSLCKTGVEMEVPQENQGSNEEIEKYITANELSELDSAALAIIMIADEEN